MRRKVVGYGFEQSKYSRPCQGTVTLLFECGHKRPQKSSIPIPLRAECRQCEQEKTK